MLVPQPNRTRRTTRQTLLLVCALAFCVPLLLAVLPRYAAAGGSLAPSIGRVVTNNHDKGPGSLRQVVLEANPGDIIAFAPDVRGVITLSSGPLWITTALTIAGPGVEVLALQAADAQAALVVAATNVSITDLAIRARMAQFMFPYYNTLINQGSLWLRRTYVEATMASTLVGFFGALKNEGTLTLTHSTVKVVYLPTASERPSPTCNIHNGLHNTGFANIADSNLDSGYLLSIHSERGQVVVQNVTAHDIWNKSGDMSLLNVTGDSVAYGFGPSGCFTGGDAPVVLTMSHSTFNTIQRVTDTNYTATIGSSIIAQSCDAGIVSLGYNLTSGTGCSLTATHDITSADMRLAPLGNYGGPTQTRMPLPGSPAIDAADNATCPATDQRGVARPIDGDQDGVATCDIGAVEFTLTNTHWLPFVAR